MAPELRRRSQPWLGTLVEVAVPPTHADAIPAAFAEVARVHHAMSFHSEQSDLARLRHCERGARLRLDPWTVQVLAEAKRLHDLSNGVFDITVASSLVAWGFLPRPSGVDLRRYRGSGMHDLAIENAEHVHLARPLLVDLGGIAKGFAVDRGVEALIHAGVPCGLINAGGDLRVFGDLTAPVFLRSPRWDGVTGAIELREAALASSSNSHNRRRHRGRERSPHLDAWRAAILSEHLVSIEAPTAMLADALTKIVLADAALGERLAGELGARVVCAGIEAAQQ